MSPHRRTHSHGHEPAPVAVRAVAAADLDYVWEMVRSLAAYEHMTDVLTGSPERLAGLLFHDPPALFGLVAQRADGRLVGYALYHFTYSSFRTNQRMWLEDLFVEESARGTGAGDQLFHAFVADALARGCHRVDWHVLESNPARAFYERQGARRTDEGLLQYGMDATVMRRVVERD
ncbi:MAG: GNAT family N-acetyltransferase [Candidatus Eisenbacteria bacterium]